MNKLVGLNRIIEGFGILIYFPKAAALKVTVILVIVSHIIQLRMVGQLVNKEMEIVWNEVVVSSPRYYPETCLGGLRNTTNYFILNSWCSEENSCRHISKVNPELYLLILHTRSAGFTPESFPNTGYPKS